MNIDRNTQIPLHVQLATLLKAQIVAGVFTAGASLPSEREMCEQYNISRTTVREALHQLEREGLVHKFAGRGIFVSEPLSKLAIHVSLRGYTADVKREGGFPASSLLNATILNEPPREILDHLQLDSHDEVVKIVRLRYNNNVPLALHTVFLNHRLCPHILDHNLSKESLFNILNEKYDLKLMKAQEQIYACLANQEELNLLSIAYPAAVLRSERTIYTESDQIIEYSRATYCGDSYRMIVDLDAQNTIK